MGIVFTIPGTDFSETGVPLDSILPIDNDPILILDSGNYNESTGIWADVQTGKTATAPSGSTAPGLVNVKGKQIPFFSGNEANVLSVALARPELDQFTFNYVAYNREQISAIHYLFDLIQSGDRFLGTISYSSALEPRGPKIFTTADSWQNLDIPALGAGDRLIMTISVDRSTGNTDVYVNGSLLVSLSLDVKTLSGDLYLGGPNSLSTIQLMDGYIANFSIYEGAFDVSKAAVYYNIMDAIYGV